MKTPCDKLARIYTSCSDHMTKMVAMPIYGKTLKILLKNQKADYLVTWYVALGDVRYTKSVHMIILG